LVKPTRLGRFSVDQLPEFRYDTYIIFVFKKHDSNRKRKTTPKGI